MKNEAVVELIILLTFLVYSNPSRAELDTRLYDTLNSNFVKGVAKYFSVNFGGAFTDCWVFSHLYLGKKGYYIGVGGMWIDPCYWSTVSGLVAVAMVSLSIVKTIKWKEFDENWPLFFISILTFIFFSETVELKMGRSNMAAFISCCSVVAICAMHYTTSGIRRIRDISVLQICRACASAFLCYLATASKSPNRFFLLDGIVVHRNFRWKGLEIDYSQAVLANVLCQLGSSDFVGFSGTITGAFFQEALRWITDFQD